MRVVITGGAGFIGHHLVRAALAAGDDVRVVDNFSTGQRARLAPLANEIDLVEADVREPEAIARVLEGAELVWHLAALPSAPRSIEDPVRSNDVNVGGTINVVEAAARAGVRRVVVAGSSSVYGAGPIPCSEAQRPQPRSPYAVSKLAAEGYALTLGALRGIEVVALRYFSVFGPGQDPESRYAAVIPRVIASALDGRRPTIHGDGTQTRDFTYVDNVVAATLLAAHATSAAGRVINVGCGARRSLLDIVTAVSDAMGVDLVPVFDPPRPGDVRDSEADISLAAELLDYRPAVDVATGIQLTVDAYLGVRAATA